MSKQQSPRSIYDTIINPIISSGERNAATEKQMKALSNWGEKSLSPTIVLFDDTYELLSQSKKAKANWRVEWGSRGNYIGLRIDAKYRRAGSKHPQDNIKVYVYMTFTLRKTTMRLRMWNNKLGGPYGNDMSDSRFKIDEIYDDVEVKGIMHDDVLQKCFKSLASKLIKKLETRQYYIKWIPLEYATGCRKSLGEWNKVFIDIQKRLPNYSKPIGRTVFQKPKKFTLTKNDGLRVMKTDIGIIKAFLEDPKRLDLVGRFTQTEMITGFNQDGTYRGLKIKDFIEARGGGRYVRSYERDDITGGQYSGNLTYPERINPKHLLPDFWTILTGLGKIKRGPLPQRKIDIQSMPSWARRQEEWKMITTFLRNICFYPPGYMSVVASVPYTKSLYSVVGNDLTLTWPRFYLNNTDIKISKLGTTVFKNNGRWSDRYAGGISWVFKPSQVGNCNPIDKTEFHVVLQPKGVAVHVEIVKPKNIPHYTSQCYPTILHSTTTAEWEYTPLQTKILNYPYDKSMEPLSWINMILAGCSKELETALDFVKNPKIINGVPIWLLKRRVCLGSLQQQKSGFQKTKIPLWSLGEWKKVLKLYLPKADLKVVKKHSSWKSLDIEMKGLSEWIQRQPDKATFDRFDIIPLDKVKDFESALREYLKRKKK